MVLNLDAEEILRHLNDLGYRNISSAQLKEFMKDLRKLIKYEQKICLNLNGIIEDKENEKDVKGPSVNRLCRKLKSKSNPPIEHQKNKNQNNVNVKTTNHTTKRAKSGETQKNVETVSLKDKLLKRPKSSSYATTEKDPVKLYHYYKKEWDRFKNNFPGENSHHDLRWNIRRRFQKNEKL